MDLLEDLELRFAKSKHLKNEQREEYVKIIEDLIKKIIESKSIIIPSYEKVLANLEESIESDDKESIKQNLNFLRSNLTIQKDKKDDPELLARIMAIFGTVAIAGIFIQIITSGFDLRMIIVLLISIILLFSLISTMRKLEI